MVSEWRPDVQMAYNHTVLILVLVEDGLGGELSNDLDYYEVLILVLVEDGLGVGPTEVQAEQEWES